MKVEVLNPVSLVEVQSPTDVSVVSYDTSLVGLYLIKTQTIGSGVASVSINDVFSTNFVNYKITLTDGAASATPDLRFSLGASTASYYFAGEGRTFSGGTNFGFNGSNVAFWLFGSASTANTCANVDIFSPALAKQTMYQASLSFPTTTGYSGYVCGYHNVATAYTDFTITTSTGTLTGGTIRVYGYRS